MQQKTWWKESVVYQIYPRSYQDSNGDGIGDIPGIISRLDYIQSLGVDIIWLSPVYQSPNDDNGYDISDYYAIMDDFGTMDDFDRMLQGIHDRGMKLIMDLVVNHTSDEHAWFVESRASNDNRKRDFYIWRPEKDGGPPTDWLSFFSGSAWQYDAQTGAYYLHLFSRKQPDLNWENPEVRREIYDMMRFWGDKGIDGFRMDVISLISKRPLVDAHTTDFGALVHNVYSTGPRIHSFLQEMHAEVMVHYDWMTVGEGPGITADRAHDYVGAKRRELDTIFHFDHMSLGNGPGGKYDPQPIDFVRFKKIFGEWDSAMEDDGWVSIFLDNHDFARMVSKFGNDDLYHVESAKCLAMLILTMRGTPYLYQGSEIGMTNVAFSSIDDYDDVELINAYKEVERAGGDVARLLQAALKVGRDNARTPMQWDDSPHAGFTTETPWLKVNPNYKMVNVAAQQSDPDSILNFYRKMLQIRKQHTTLVYGTYDCIAAEHPQVFAYWRISTSVRYLIMLNMSDLPANINVDQLQDFDIILSNLPDQGQFETAHFALRPWEGLLIMGK